MRKLLVVALLAVLGCGPKEEDVKQATHLMMAARLEKEMNRIMNRIMNRMKTADPYMGSRGQQSLDFSQQEKLMAFCESHTDACEKAKKLESFTE
jgi:hypothetical protein